MRPAFRGIFLLVCLLIATAGAGKSTASPPYSHPQHELSPSPSSDQMSGETPPTTANADESDDTLESEESLARLQQVLQRRPLHSTAFKELVQHYTERGKLSDLVKSYERQVELLPEDMNLQILLARLYARAGEVAKAAELIEQLDDSSDKMRSDSAWMVFKSEVYQKSGKLDDAVAVLNQALTQAKTISERLRLSEGLADLHLRANNKSEAATVLIRLAEEFRDNYLHRKRLADELAQRDLHAEAVEQYREILSLVENQPDERCEVLRQLGSSLERLEKRGDAIEAYTQAVNLLSSGHWLQRELNDRIVNLYRAAGRMDELVQYCRDQVDRAPEQGALRCLLADVLFANGDTDAAKQTMTEAVQLFPKDRELSQRRIQLLERLTDASGAAAEYERIIAEFPEEPELYITYGQFLATNKQLEAARNQWKHVLNSDLADASLAHRLGTLFEPLDLLEDAVECYERAIQLSPRQPDSYAALSRLWFFRGEKDKALDALTRLAAANPDDATNQSAACQAAMAIGLADEALVMITRACELDATKAEYRLTRADLLVQTGQLDQALDTYRAALDLMNNPVQQAEAIGTLASMFASANRLDQLKEAERQRLNEDPTNAVSLLLLVRAADIERDLPAARKALETLLAAQPTHEEAGRQLARMLESLGDVDRAVEQYRKLIDLHPNRARQYYQAIADLRLRYEDKAGAIETFEKMVAESADNATVLKDVAEQIVRLSEYDKGLGFYEQSLRIQPDRHEVRLSYAKALEEAGRLDDALAAYRLAALQRSDRDTAAEALNRLHETAARLGQLDQLIDELQARVETDPEERIVARMLAELLIREFEYNRAMELLDLVLRRQPNDVELQIVRAELQRRLARFDDAVDGYQRVLRRPDVDRDFVLGELGKTYFEAGRVDQARSVWRQIGHKLYAGTLLRNNGLLKDAIEILREGIRLKPNDYGLHRNLIKALHVAGQTDEALEAARRLLDLEPDNVMNIRELAKAYIEHGDRDAATEIAGRLFGAAVTEKKPGGQANQQSGYGMQGAPLWMISLRSSWRWYGGQSSRNNLDAAVEFFQENGLMAELEHVLEEQLAAQPTNAVLRQKAVELFSELFNKPDVSMRLLKELEQAEYPLEYQTWLGQCSQRDYIRVQEFQLIASKPMLRDRRLAELESKPDTELTREELLELAVIRHAQGATERAIEILRRVLDKDPEDLVARSAVTDLLVRAERWSEAEPHARLLSEQLAEQREQMQGEMIERVRRDFVRTLPLQFQLRVTEDLLHDIARKWTLGQSFVADFTGGLNIMGYFRARLTLAAICAKTDRLNVAREIWTELSPTHPADADGWTMLAGVAQSHNQDQLAYEYYRKALAAARQLKADPLLQRIYGGSAGNIWYDEDEEQIDSMFNRIVEAFAAHDQLIELYDFLRETEQAGKARRLAEQYKLEEKLKDTYAARVAEARAEFLNSTDSALTSSPPYFVQVCKLAELYDRGGNWPAAQSVYEGYLADFPDELGLLQTLGEVAEASGEQAEAIQWEQKVVETKERLARRAWQWTIRELPLTPSRPQALAANARDSYTWSARWGKNPWWWWGGNQGKPLDVWPSWLRIARLYLTVDNPVAAGRALERAVAAAGSDRDQVSGQVLNLIRQRQLIGPMLSVLRSLAVQQPTDESIQLAFAESLYANEKQSVAAEVYRRMLRRGVTDIGVLAKVRRQLAMIDPSAAEAAGATLESLAAEVDADPENANARLRLAKAYYYSLQMEPALEQLNKLLETAPHLEGVHDLLIEIQMIRGDSEALILALRTKIERVNDDDTRRKTRRRLLEELLSLGRIDEAIELLKDIPDSKNPQSYEQAALLLHYFGRYDEAVALYELAERSQNRSRYGGQAKGMNLARYFLIRGDLSKAAVMIIKAADDQAAQTNQYGGLYSVYSIFDQQENYFQAFAPLFVAEPALITEVEQRLRKRYDSDPDDPAETNLLMQFYSTVGRPDRAEALLERLATDDVTDQRLVTLLIQRAEQRKEYAKAIKLAEDFIAQQPKPTLPPGIPAQFVGRMLVMSPRNVMLCQLGDIHWKQGNEDKAFECYRLIIDEQADESKLAYAAICLLRGRLDEARTIVDTSLEKQQIKSAALLEFRCMIAALSEQPGDAFEYLKQALEVSGDTAESSPYGDGGPGNQTLAALAKLTNRIDDFAAFMETRLAKNPNDWSNYQLLAQAFMEAGRPTDAFAVLDRAGEVKTLKLEALQARVRWQEGHVPDAELIPLYEQMVELSEREVKDDTRNQYYWNDDEAEVPNYRMRLGDLYWRVGQPDKAMEIWSARLDRQSADTHVKLGRFCLEREDYRRATESLHKALELQPNEEDAHRELAGLAILEGDADTALSHLRESYKVDARASVAQSSWRDMYSSRSSQSPQSDDETRMRVWALELARDAKVQERLGADAPEEGDARFALASLTGDWSELEKELQRRLAAAPYDPVVWRLWAQALERKGRWAEAVEAWEYIRRLKQTTITEHEDQLQLVLAGKQIKDARAGIKDDEAAQAIARASGNMSYRGSYSYYGYYNADVRHLAALYLRLGQPERAERLYLLSVEQSGVNELSALANLMWQQGAKERAAELMRLGMLMGNQRFQISQYAGMLAQIGRAQEGVDILERAYRISPEPQAQNSMYMYYGYYGSDQTQQLETSDETQNAGALFELLQRTGQLESELSRLCEECRANPKDTRLSKLTLSMLTRARRWDAARDALAAWREVQPYNTGVLLEQFHVCLQLEDCDGALQILSQLRDQAPDSPNRWRIHEALVHLLRGDFAAVGPTLDPSLSSPRLEAEGFGYTHIAMLLGAARDYERLIGYLNRLYEHGMLDDEGQHVLLAAYQARGDWAAAGRQILARIWNGETPLTRDSHYLALLTELVRCSPDVRASIAAATETPEDQALLRLLIDGPAAGRASFAELVAIDPDNSHARRGLVLANSMAGDWAGAAEANAALIAWLEPRRREIWWSPSGASLGDMAQTQLAQMKAGGVNSQAVLTMSMGFGSLIEQMLGQMIDQDQRSGRKTYENLWKAHLLWQNNLLARAGRTDELTELLKTQAALAHAGEYSGEDNNSYGRRYYRSYRSYSRSYSYYRNARESEFDVDWRSVLHKMLAEGRQFDALCQEAAQRGLRLPVEEWDQAAESHATNGRDDEAHRWQTRYNDVNFACLCGSDLPRQESETDRYGWWGWYSRDSEQVQRMRSELNIKLDPAPDEDDPDWTPTNVTPDSIARQALVDPAVAERLEEAARIAGPGWAGTRTVGAYLGYCRARADWQAILQLLERTCTLSELMQSGQLSDYLRAAFALKDVERVEKVLQAALECSSSLENDVLVARLMLLRHVGENAKADALERDLVQRCVAERPNPAEFEESFVDALSGNITASRSYYQVYYDYGDYYSNDYYGSAPRWRGGNSTAMPGDLPGLAEASGVRYERKVGEQDLTLERLRGTYARHRLWAHAVCILDLELARPEMQKPSRARAELLKNKAEYLGRSGDRAAAAPIITELEKYWLARADALPNDSRPLEELGDLFSSKWVGSDYAKAIEYIRAGRNLNPLYDEHGLGEARCWFELGRHDQAWKLFKAALANAAQFDDIDILYQAGIAAAKSGQLDAGRTLLRQAHWRYPAHRLASQSAEWLK